MKDEKMKEFLSRYKTYLLFTAIVFTGLAIAFFAMGGYYPIALVNGNLVSARTFSREYAAADAYYRRVIQTYGAQALGPAALAPSDIRALVMEKVVEDALIENAARREVGADLSALVENKLSELSADGELAKAASTLYGLNKADFRNFVLVPQAERDILSGRLFLKGEKFDDWLTQAKQSANISIFSNQFRWTPQGVATSTP